MMQENLSQAERRDGGPIAAEAAERETNGHQEGLEPDLSPPPTSQESPENRSQIKQGLEPAKPLPRPSQESSESRLLIKRRHEPDLLPQPATQATPAIQLQVKRGLAAEHCEDDRPIKIPRVGGPNPGAAFDHAEPALQTSLDGDLCLRCKKLDFNFSKPECPRFKVVARLGGVDQLRKSPECRLCQLLYKVRPVLSRCNAPARQEFSLVLFNGDWARPWRAGPSSKNANKLSGTSRLGICFDTFATMDNEIMFGVLPSEGVDDPRSNTVPYLHDRLYESLTRSGYIRVIQDPSCGSLEKYGPKSVGSSIDWDSLRICVNECAFNHSATCSTDFNNAYRPLKVIDCLSRQVVKFPHNVRYLALSYTWGSEQSSECLISDVILPDTIPTTISDAMEVTLQLGLQFLWVDRYCIPQDQEYIKHREIRHMDLIYRGAAATIVACSGMSPWHGLPGCSSRPRSGSNRVAIGDQVLFSVPPDPRYEIEASNWMSRGWTYQEGLLSRRRIFFTEEQVYFECDARHCFESTAPLLNKVFWQASQKARIFSTGGGIIGRHDFYKTVNEYSGRKLTYESDILNGVWGVLRTFHDAQHPILHYWGVPVYAGQSGYDLISGFAWDLVKPARRRAGFPSWSWSGWIGQVKPGLLVKLEHAPAHNLGPFTHYRPPMPQYLPVYSAKNEESKTVDTPQDILQVNLPNPVEEDITLWVQRIDGVPMSFLDGSLQYFNSGGSGLSRFLFITAWMTAATLSTSGVPKVTIFPPLRRHGHDSLQWLPTTDDIIHQGSELSKRVCIGILLAVREPLGVVRLQGARGLPTQTLETDYDRKEGEVVNNSWLYLFLIVEAKGKGDWFERIGLAKFLFSEKMSMQALIQDLTLEKKEIRLG